MKEGGAGEGEGVMSGQQVETVLRPGLSGKLGWHVGAPARLGFQHYMFNLQLHLNSVKASPPQGPTHSDPDAGHLWDWLTAATPLKSREIMRKRLLEHVEMN